MDTIFMNSENSRTSEYYVLVLKLTDKLDLRRGQKSVALSNFSIYSTWKNIKSSYSNNKFKISAPTWSDKFLLPGRSHSISDVQDYFEYVLKKHGENVDNPSIRIYVNKIAISDVQDYVEYVLKKHGENVDNPSIRIYVNKIENRITFKIKYGYYLELLTPETMKLLGTTKSKITKDKNGENVPHLEIVESVLIHC